MRTLLVGIGAVRLAFPNGEQVLGLGVVSKRVSLLYLCFVNRLIFIISTLPVVNMVVFPLLAFFAHGFSMGID